MKIFTNFYFCLKNKTNTKRNYNYIPPFLNSPIKVK